MLTQQEKSRTVNEFYNHLISNSSRRSEMLDLGRTRLCASYGTRSGAGGRGGEALGVSKSAGGSTERERRAQGSDQDSGHFQESGPAVDDPAAQKCWRGHDDRELFRIAMDHYTRHPSFTSVPDHGSESSFRFKLERSAAVVKLQRWARRVFWRSFGTLFRMQDTATRCLQRVVRGHRSRRKMEGLLGKSNLKQEIRYIRDVEIVRLQRTLTAVQDTMDHVTRSLAMWQCDDSVDRCYPSLVPPSGATETETPMRRAESFW